METQNKGMVYVRSFVEKRLEQNSPQNILAEFKIPATVWPLEGAADNLTDCDKLTSIILAWLEIQDDATESDVSKRPRQEDHEEPGEKKKGPCSQRTEEANQMTTSLSEGSIPGLVLIKTHPTSWTPTKSDLKVVMNIVMDVEKIRGIDDKERLDQSHLVVLDNLFGETERSELHNLLGGSPDWDDKAGPPPERWERATVDEEGLPATWGLRDNVMDGLLQGRVSAVIEIQARLQILFPEFEICHFPPSNIDVEGSFVANHLIANAAVHGDMFRWHVDADPMTLPGFGYTNREPGKPYFVTLLIYVNNSWRRTWDAETLFLDLDSETGVFVRPGKYRALLMDQDITHRLSVPGRAAEGRPRYSLVWKLVFVPKDKGKVCSIAREEWGPPSLFPRSNVANK
eukprot:m.37995 g.37995  ORF g.37995 m.37995 type:complete len:400 (-) comp9380_c0_seq4:2789-3988(-)